MRAFETVAPTGETGNGEFRCAASRWLLVAAAEAEAVPAGVAQIVELMDFGLRAYLGGAAG